MNFQPAPSPQVSGNKLASIAKSSRLILILIILAVIALGIFWAFTKSTGKNSPQETTGEDSINVGVDSTLESTLESNPTTNDVPQTGIEE